MFGSYENLDGNQRQSRQDDWGKKHTNTKKNELHDENHLLYTTINRFMVRYFIHKILKKYTDVFFSSNYANRAAYGKKVTNFLEVMLKRSKSTRLHFKKICCIIIKFADTCDTDVNYMKFLKYDVLKLVVVAFVLADNRKRFFDFDLYSRITGMSVEEIKNCCSIVRPILLKHSTTIFGDLTDHTNFCTTLRVSYDCGMEGSAGTTSIDYVDEPVSIENTNVHVLASDLENFNNIGVKMVKDYLNLA